MKTLETKRLNPLTLFSNKLEKDQPCALGMSQIRYVAEFMNVSAWVNLCLTR